LFFSRAAENSQRPFLWQKVGDKWVSQTWENAALCVSKLAAALRRLGLESGDRVALVAENQPKWVLADLAIMAAGGITVPAYTTYSIEDYRHVLADSGARFIIVGSGALARRVLPAADQLDYVQATIAFEPLKTQTRADTYSWDDLLASEENDAALANGGADDVACLLYTSNAKGAKRLLEDSFTLGDEVFLSFLPLTHSYEHTAGFVLPLYLSAQIYYSSPDSLAADMPEVRPTIMTAVPRLFETMRKRISLNMERTGGMALKLYRAALRLGRLRLTQPDQYGPLARIQDLVLDLLVRRKIRQRFGGRLKVLVAGGAPLNPELSLYFLSLGVTVIQGYGQTETGPVVGVNPPNRIKVETIGPPLEGVEVRIAEDGEIMVRGDNVMKGYWRDPEATARTIRDGWLYTGDVGHLDEDGYLVITDRKRDFIKTSGGDMISPQRIESLLTLQPGISQAYIHGDRRPYLVALIVTDIQDTDRAEAVAREAVSEVNTLVAPCDRIRRHAVLSEPFSSVNGQMTPTLKIRRHAIRETYAELIEGLYAGARGAH
jgi:long-chain acyl-CoA synthetase